MPVSNYQGLTAWQKSMDLTVEVYKLVKKLPKEETYALSDQMRRSVVSIPSNIAEGNDRKRTGEFQHFLRIAKGSASELETQLLICTRVGYIRQDEINNSLSLLDEVSKLITGLIKSHEPQTSNHEPNKEDVC